MAIKLSELIKKEALLECDGEIMSSKKVLDRIKQGVKIKEIYTVTDEYIEDVLTKSYEEYKNGKHSEFLSAVNNGQRVIIDAL